MTVHKMDKLLSEGMNPRYNVQKLIVDNYHDILAARGFRRTWQEIAEAYEVPHSRSAMSSAWSRVRKSVDEKKLIIPPKHTPARSGNQRPREQGGQHEKGQELSGLDSMSLKPQGAGK
jgi:hypothetical protein